MMMVVVLLPASRGLPGTACAERSPLLKSGHISKLVPTKRQRHAGRRSAGDGVYTSNKPATVTRVTMQEIKALKNEKARIAPGDARAWCPVYSRSGYMTETKEVRNTTETKEVRLLTADEIETVSGGGNGIPVSPGNPGVGSWQSNNKEC
jgi:hypothetical protein